MSLPLLGQVVRYSGALDLEVLDDMKRFTPATRAAQSPSSASPRR